MLDSELKSQLSEVFQALDSEIRLVYDESDHAAQSELLALIQDLAGCSSFISLSASGKTSPLPSLTLFRGATQSGVRFTGVPGGHEFSSLVVAILNLAGKGKMPDEFTRARITRLKGPIRIRTYISLSCENCPDVVQALNLFAILHPDFNHEMIDGGLAQEEVETLGIQGVPSILVGETLLHSGRISMIDLLALLEGHFGSEAQDSTPMNQDLGEFDVLVVGGGPAGASAAIYSARKGLSTAIIAEKIGGQVQETKGIENLISVPYTEGPRLTAELSRHLEHYPIRVLEHRKVKSISTDSVKAIELMSGETLRAKSVIIATGAKWRELGIPGEKEYLGRGVAFCPHCDGPFYKNKIVAVIGGGNSGIEAAIDLAGIAKHVTVFEYQDTLKADQVLVDKLNSLPNTQVITGVRTQAIEGDGQKVHTLVYDHRASGEERRLPLDGVFVQIGLLPNSQFLKGTLELTPMGEIPVDAKGRTSVPGIYAAGDVTTTPFKQIIIAMGEGAKAALTAFEDRMLAKSH
jgi:alkyl hydroperoxide reductase subunit F